MVRKFLWSLYLKRTPHFFNLLKSKPVSIIMETTMRVSLLGILFTVNR